MEDRELLELAAKAAFAGFDEQMLEDGWNPLADDGDALRLAVKIGLAVRVDLDLSITFVAGKNDGAFVRHDKDAEEATRRAIVIAAARSQLAI